MRKKMASDHECCWCKKVFEHDAYPLVSLALALSCDPSSDCYALICSNCQESHKRTKCVKHSIRSWIVEAKIKGTI